MTTLLPEAALDAGVHAQLPTTTPGAPWQVRCALTMWWQRAPRDARALLPAQLRDRPQVPLTSWMLVRYAQTPVGAYDEVVCSPVLLLRPRAIHVPFIAVDSVPSVHAGRTHWLLPKVLANFSYDDHTTVVTGEQEPRWQVRVSARPVGPAISIPGASVTQQVDDAGVVHTYRTTLRGRGRLARIHVDGRADGPLQSLIRPGRHWGVVMPDVSLRVGAG